MLFDCFCNQDYIKLDKTNLVSYLQKYKFKFCRNFQENNKNNHNSWF